MTFFIIIYKGNEKNATLAPFYEANVGLQIRWNSLVCLKHV